MKVRISAGVFQEMLNALKPFARQAIGSSVPATLHLTAQDDRVFATTGASDGVARVSREAIVELQGFVVLPAKMLMDLAKAFPEEDVTLEKDGRALRVACGNVRTRVMTLQEDWDPDFASEWPGFVNAVDLRGAVKLVQHAVARGEAHGVYRGVQLEIASEGLKLVATDRVQLAVASVEDAGGFDAKVVIHREHAKALPKVFCEDEELRVAVDEAYVQLAGENALLKLPIMEGVFLDYEPLLAPVEDAANIRVDAGSLHAAVNRAAILSQYADNDPVVLAVQEDGMVVRGENTYGTLTERIDTLPTLDGKANTLRLTLNARMLRDSVRHLEGSIQISSVPSAGGKPVKIAPVDTDAYACVLAPLLVEEMDAEEAASDPMGAGEADAPTSRMSA